MVVGSPHERIAALLRSACGLAIEAGDGRLARISIETVL
jgi:hypothetical protein